jgi:WhiB family transcriptional regulator, redox-sensing transcriptional regulator
VPALKLLKLPPPVAELWDWQMDAACRDVDGALFFYPDNERGEAREDRVAAAKRICAACPVQARCRRYALEAGEPYGMWGGLTEEERRAARSDRRVR